MRILTPDNNPEVLAPDGTSGAVSEARGTSATLTVNADGAYTTDIITDAAPGGLYEIFISYVCTAAAAAGAGTGSAQWTDQNGAQTFNFSGGTLDITTTTTIWDEYSVSIGAGGTISTTLTVAGYAAGPATVEVRAAVIRLL